MTIKIRLIVGFMGIAVLCLAVGPVALKVSRSDHISQGIATTTANIEMVKSREIDHLKWLGKLDNLFLMNQAELKLQTDYKKCKLGKSIYGEAYDEVLASDPELAAYFDKIKPSHAAFHNSAVTIGEAWQQVHPGLENTLLARLVDHQHWASTMAGNLLAGEEPGVQTDPTKCEFGLWLKSAEVAKLQKTWPEFAELMGEIDSHHSELHQTALLIENTNDQILRHEIFQNRIRPQLEELEEHFEAVIAMEHIAMEAQAVASHTLETVTNPAIKEVQAIMVETVAYLSEKRENQQAALAATAKRQVIFTWGGSLLALSLAMGLGLWLIRAIVGPINRTVAFTNAFGQGDLSQRLNLKTNDELGQMTHALDEMADNLELKANMAQTIADGDLTQKVDPTSEKDTLGLALRDMNLSLREVVSKASLAANEVDQGSSQLSAASQSLAEGATEQAASLQETHASVTEIRDQAKESARLARGSASTAEVASDAAAKSNNHMTDMIKAMGDIADSSSEIAKIIKVIDDIAFQTNLLALNAAVEAARAGKHGKGFAVVAEEVRTLAQRSAKAASETAELIEGSGERVSHGSEVAEQTGQALTMVVNSIGEITGTISEIASMNEQQSEAVDQITLALEQIDTATQASTASAEETASVSAELSSQTRVLMSLLNHFKVGATQAPAHEESAAEVVAALTQETAWPEESMSGLKGWDD